MTNQPVLRSRATPATAPVPASEASAHLDVEMRRAQAIAKASDAVPQSYRGQPGAVLLAMSWAESRNIDLLTAIQTVSFINGRPSIDATMQRALAERDGYRVTILEAEPKFATVRIADRETGEVLGEATYTLDDAKRAGLSEKTNWKNNPEDMCVARATTRAMRRFAPAVMVGLVTEDESDEIDPDPIAVLDNNAGGDRNPETVDVTHDPVGESEEPSATAKDEVAPGSPPAPDDDVVADAELVDEKISPATRGKVLAAMTAAKRRDNWGDLAQTMQGEGIQMVVSKMTEAEGWRTLEILEDAP